MGFWNDGITSSRARSRSRSRSPSRRKHYSSRPSNSRSASSFFSLPNFSTSSHKSYGSRAKPRSGFVNRIRRFLREVYSYMRRHPVRVFMLVILPLLTGGVLTKLLATVGIRLPAGVERMMGQMGGQRGYSESERFYARGGARDFGGGTSLPGIGGGMGDSLGSLLGIAKMFI